MGCWSENCALSGLEIRSGDEIYYAIMTPSKSYGDHMVANFIAPPLRGVYDYYGGCTLSEPYKPMKLKKGDTLVSGCSGDAENLRFIINAQVFDSLESITPDFAYDYATKKSFKTIGEALDNTMAKLKRRSHISRCLFKIRFYFLELKKLWQWNVSSRHSAVEWVKVNAILSEYANS